MAFVDEQPSQGQPSEGDSARREIYRKLREAHATLSAGEAARTLRFDVGQTGLASLKESPRAPRRKPHVAPSSRPGTTAVRSSDQQLLVWAIGALGCLALGLGIGLCCWSIVGERPLLWSPGLVLSVGGQGLVIVALLQLLMSIWSAGRYASAQIDQMHGEVRRLRRMQEEATGRHAASAASFYSELARDAGPDMLLGSLQGQVDRLAARLRHEEGASF